MPNELIRQKNEQTVLRQAMKLFVANGVENTSVEMIARNSNLTLRAVQNYYRTKTDLITAVLNHALTIQLDEMKSFFESEQYRSKKGAEQILEIVTVALDKAIKNSDIIFCAAQMQHILSQAPGNDGAPQLSGNWRYVMEQLQMAFAKGTLDGSLVQKTEKELIDVKTIMLALRGIQEQVAFALRDQELKQLFEPETTVKKYIRQMEMMLMAKQ